MLSAKRIVFIRHGRTFMNDYINGVNYGAPGFSDVFENPKDLKMYVDSPLAPRGIEQAKTLLKRLHNLENGKEGALNELSLSSDQRNILNELELIVVSPLTRALQTMEIGLYPLLKTRNVPIVAHPDARERLYLCADLGKSRSELKQIYDYVDFDSAFDDTIGLHDPWHWEPTTEEKANYQEWRPHGEGQVYSHLGELEEVFNERMNNLYQWLESRTEHTVALVCHYAVIDWFLKEGFENCELRIVPFEELKPRALKAADLAKSATPTH
jgi:broad specificity phosphatase PhoE